MTAARKPSLPDLARILALGAVYYASARLGLMLDAVAGVATPVWPPSGLSLAALLLFGYRVWPGIALGAFFANFHVGQPWGVALGIAVGNTLEPVLGATLLRRVGFRPDLERLRDVLALVFLAGFCSTVLSATIGVASVGLAGRLSAATLVSTWWTWWSGDLLSDLIVAPVALTWSRPPSRREVLRRGPEFLVLVTATVLASQMTFGVWSVFGTTPYPLVYMIFAFAIWAALRFRPREASAVVLVVACLAVWNTTRGIGPFFFATIHESLLALQFFVGILAVTSLVLTAVFTERRRAEAEARELIAELRRLGRLKSEFASIVAHELKTPLTVVKEGIRMVLDGVDGEVNERQAETLHRAMDNVDRLIRLIANVLNYEKLESGRLELEPTDADLGALAEGVCQFMELLARKKKIRLHLERPKEAIALRCDPDKIKEVLINLIDNALKNTPRGGEVWIRLKASPASVVLEVEDTGRGIPQEEQAGIFLMFRQAQSSERVRIPGAGIGLAVCKLIAELHGGRIGVASEPGRGAKFTVELPLRPGGLAPRGRPAETGSTAGWS